MILKTLAMFVFGETVAPTLNKIGEAVGERLARKLDPEGAELTRMAVYAQAAQAGLFEEEVEEVVETPKPKKPRKKSDY